MTILEEANELINGDRAEEYGDPKITYKKACQMFEAWCGKHISVNEFLVLMTFMKLARDKHKHKHDNLLDAVGYLGLVGEGD